MRRALELARRGMGETNPNPMVGAVVVRRGRVVGEGWHERAGWPHAEIVALREAGNAARGATLYLTLEPCAHQGRTAPCAPAVTAAGIARTVVAMKDPNPAVNGRGLRYLQAGGVRTMVGTLAAEATQLNARFVVAMRSGRPFVLLKAALTLDGRIATAAGESKWITTPTQRSAARALRRLHDGVAVGVGTVIADDPLLLPSPRVRRPFHRIVFDSTLRTPLRSRLVETASAGPVWVLTMSADVRRRRALEARGVRVLRDERPRRRAGLVDAAWAMARLRREGLTSLMVEGGSELLGSFLDARLVDEVVLFRAPLLLGGRDSRPAFGGEGSGRLADALRLRPLPIEDGAPWCERWAPISRHRLGAG